MTPRPQIIIIGMDGATMDLIRPWAAQGRLPTLRRLIENGVSGDLRSTIPPVTAPAWTSFMTGKNPGKHNLFDFVEHPPGTYEIRYTNSLSRGAATIWRMLSDAGKKVGVVNVPMTYPPEEIHGFFISGLDTPDEESDFIRPHGLKQELESVFGKIRLDIRYLSHMRSDRSRDRVLREFIELEEQRKNISLYLLERYPVDVFMVVFNSTDQVQHHFWHYMDASHPNHDERGREKYGDAIYGVYRKLDDNLAEVLSALGEDTVCLVMSDHGAGSASARQLFLNNYLKKIGLLQYKADEKRLGGVRSLFWDGMKALESFLKARLSTRQKMLLARLFPRIRNRFESYLSLSQIEWNSTRAYSTELLVTSPNVWINLKRKRPHGIVDDKDYDGLIDFILKKLYELKDSDGNEVIRKAYRKEEIYSGRYIENAPDIVFDWWTGDGFTAKSSLTEKKTGTYLSSFKGKLRGGVDWSGTHKINGTFLAGGYPFKKGFGIDGARIVDLAPTILYIAGAPIPEDMDGRVLLECIDEAFTETHPVTYGKGKGSGETSERPGGYTDEDAGKIKERLRQLGYIE